MENFANEFLRSIGKSLFEMEMSQEVPMQMPTRRRAVQPVTNFYLEAISAVLVQRADGNQEGARRLLANIMQDLHDQAQSISKEKRRNVYFLYQQLVQKFVSLCSNANWRRKMAACTAVQIMISEEVHLGALWPFVKEVDLARALMIILKDMPMDPPAEVPEVTNTILNLIRFCNENRSERHAQVDKEATDGTPEAIAARDWVQKALPNKAEMYLTVFMLDLGSATAAVRETTQASLELIAELAGLKYSEFIRPSVEKITSTFLHKPLRIYQAPVQIGYMEAMRYLLKMEPPVLEASEEIWRLLNEVIALGEADDLPINPLQKMTRRMTQLTGNTKAASIRLITASLVVADYFSKQPQIRQR
jgi:transformation/transcription domain-associated protein